MKISKKSPTPISLIAVAAITMRSVAALAQSAAPAVVDPQEAIQFDGKMYVGYLGICPVVQGVFSHTATEGELKIDQRVRINIVKGAGSFKPEDESATKLAQLFDQAFKAAAKPCTGLVGQGNPDRDVHFRLSGSFHGTGAFFAPLENGTCPQNAEGVIKGEMRSDVQGMGYGGTESGNIRIKIEKGKLKLLKAEDPLNYPARLIMETLDDAFVNGCRPGDWSKGLPGAVAPPPPPLAPR